MKRLLFRNYWVASSLRYWFSRRFTKSGILVICGLFLTLGLAFDTEQSLAYQTFALLFCLCGVSLVGSVFFRARFSVVRHLPRFGSVGVSFQYRLTVQNRSGKPQQGLVLLEDLEDPRLMANKYLFRISLTRKGKTLGLFQAQQRIRFARVQEAPIPPLLREASGSVDSTILPLRRGILRF